MIETGRTPIARRASITYGAPLMQATEEHKPRRRSSISFSDEMNQVVVIPRYEESQHKACFYQLEDYDRFRYETQREKHVARQRVEALKQQQNFTSATRCRGQESLSLQSPRIRATLLRRRKSTGTRSGSNDDKQFAVAA